MAGQHRVRISQTIDTPMSTLNTSGSRPEGESPTPISTKGHMKAATNRIQERR
jgi:hypothetical protein